MAILDIVIGNAAVAVTELARGNSGTISDISVYSNVIPPRTCVEMARGNIGILTDISTAGFGTDTELILVARSGPGGGMNRGLS